MAVALLKEPPLTPPTELGPYRSADYDALPDEPRCELIFGRFYWSPAPSIPHQIVAGVFYRTLDDTADEPGGLAIQAPLGGAAGNPARHRRGKSKRSFAERRA